MLDPSFSLDVIEIASPCSVTWDQMHGTDTVRRCDECRLNVFNLSEMTRDEAKATIIAHEGRLCVHLYRRRDGTVLTQDCPVAVRALRRQVARLIAGIVAMVSFLAAGCLFAKFRSESPRNTVSVGASIGPIEKFIDWIDPFRYPVAGNLCPPSVMPILPPVPPISQPAPATE